MENQGKRLILAVALALGIVLIWNFLFPSAQKPKTPPPGPQTVEQKSTVSPVGVPTGASEAPEAPSGPEQVTVFDYPNIHIELTNRDAKVMSWKLMDPKYRHDFYDGEMVRDPSMGALGINFFKSNIVIPQGARWQKLPDEEEKPNEATYTYDSSDLKVTKVFHIHPDDYLLDMTVTVELKADPAKPKEARTVNEQLAVQTASRQDPKAPYKEARTVRLTRAACLFNGGVRQWDQKKLIKSGPYEQTGEVRWVGYNHPYLFFAVAPKQSDVHNLGCNAYGIPDSDDASVPKGRMEVDLVYPAYELNSSAPPVTWQTVAFIGPKHLTALEGADDVEGFNTGFSHSVSLGWFSIIARPLLSILIWFHGFVGNWAISIILLTICVKLATLYWTTKSMRSMKQMAALRPKMEELQAKYGEDKARIQQEMMGIYKAHGVNPLSGCLPMLLQMPIWLALYRMLSSAGELYLVPGIPGWLNDLTATDPYHILPFTLVGMMFLQSRMSPAQVDNFQQKMMIYGLPLIFGVMSFFFPSGLTIYILTNTTLSLLHTLYMRKWDKGGKMIVPVVTKAASTAKPSAKKAVIDVPAKAKKDDDDDDGDDAEGVDDDGGDDEADEPKPSAAPQNQRSNARRRKRKRKH